MVKKFFMLQNLVLFHNYNDKNNFLYAIGVFAIPNFLNNDRFPLLSAIVFSCFIAIVGYVNFGSAKKLIRTFPISDKMQIFNMYMSGIVFLALLYFVIMSVLTIIMLVAWVAYVPEETTFDGMSKIAADGEMLKNIAITACMLIVYFASIHIFYKIEHKKRKTMYSVIFAILFILIGFLIQDISLTFVYGIVVLAIASMFVFPYLSYKTCKNSYN